MSPVRRTTVVDDDTWPSLLPDLLLGIFRRLRTTDITRCSCTCKPWRRAIIGFAAPSHLRPRPDRFAPDLLLHCHGASHYYKHAPLRRVPGPLQSALPSTGNHPEAAHCFVLPAGDRASSYGEVLSSRDGFVLLIDTMRRAEGLCLSNLVTGACTFLPAADVEDCEYSLVTAHDLSVAGDEDDDTSLMILAMAGTEDTDTVDDSRITYHLFSLPSGDAAGTWGPVQRLGQLIKGYYHSYIEFAGNMVVCRGGAVHWLAGPPERWGYRRRLTCTVALDVRTGRAWTTELPTQGNFYYDNDRSLLLAGDVRRRRAVGDTAAAETPDRGVGAGRRR
ncbi:hypothetical protein HU200_053944 [Digitaria exilis]|uniref:F-box domain-containing protein n=1 Tax=Digitaria exilis TaxID=1010633 RepID=A0A835E7Z5_9POAL|nr:hypothetical protein HU200_053944 [Digitaria exilis]